MIIELTRLPSWVNLGGSIDLKLSEKLIFNVQAKYIIADDRGANYCLSWYRVPILIV
jgi:hypothetical protein